MTAKVLYIEDNPDNMLLVEKILRPLGYQFLEAFTGEAGLEAAEEHCPDLILLDITLPDINGIEIARRLRANPATATIPILALTAHTLIGDGENVLEAGCNAYMIKPISVSELQARVQSFLSSPQA